MVFIEIGNSSVKAVRSGKGQRMPLFRVDVDKPDLLVQQLQQIEMNEFVLLSSVRKDLSGLIHKQAKHVNLHEITKEHLGIIELDYETPETLGIDRVIACTGAVGITQNDVVVIDAGTACTVDFMTKEYCFKGGVIMPGIPILRQSMKMLLPELPRVASSVPDQFPGRSTTGAIQIGLNGGFMNAIESFIRQYLKLYPEAKVLFTGGDGKFVAENLGDKNEDCYYENLVFDGMETYLEINGIETS